MKREIFSCLTFRKDKRAVKHKYDPEDQIMLCVRGCLQCCPLVRPSQQRPLGQPWILRRPLVDILDPECTFGGNLGSYLGSREHLGWQPWILLGPLVGPPPGSCLSPTGPLLAHAIHSKADRDIQCSRMGDIPGHRHSWVSHGKTTTTERTP